MGDSLPGLQARLMSQALRKLTGSISKSNTMVIFINQIRMKIGVMFGSPGNHDRRQCAEVLRLGPPRHPPHRRDQGPRRGGRQPDPRQGGQEQGGAAVQAGRVRHHVWRGHLQGGRTGRSRRQGRHRREVGAWFSYDSQRIGQGRENAKPSCGQPDIANEIEQAIAPECRPDRRRLESEGDEAATTADAGDDEG
jgi:recombination protein RecA